MILCAAIFSLAASAGVSADLQLGVSSEDLIPISSSQLISKGKANTPQPDVKTYIVQMYPNPVITYGGEIKGLMATKPERGNKINPDSDNVKNYTAYLEGLHNDALRKVGAEKISSFKYSFNGFTARLAAKDLAILQKRDDVIMVWEDEMNELHTDTSPTFIGLTGPMEPWSMGYSGENITVGIIDTGINPYHPSFADTMTPQNGNKGPMVAYGDPPKGWSGTACELEDPSLCTKKLLTARCYAAAFSEKVDPDLPCGGDGAYLASDEVLSAHDSDGHGSHVASTSAGNFGVETTLSSLERTISGMAPRARLAVYKTCWKSWLGTGCSTSDAVAAIDQAVEDGVDVLNYSIGSSNLELRADDIAFMCAADAGVFVATSNGNSGPNPETVSSPAFLPWVTSVGAVEDDGVFATGVVVSDPAEIADTYLAIEGVGPVKLADTGDISAIVVPVSPLNGCLTLTNPTEILDRIALVIRGACTFKAKYDNAAAAGAKAIVVYNDGAGAGRFHPFVMIELDGVTIPGVAVSYFDGALMETTASGGEAVTATLSPSIKLSRQDRTAAFSSRGPNGGAPDIIKPDIVAPGVSILAASHGINGENFATLSGTSMASPHVAGIFALLKQANPEWSPAMAKSALMTSARQNLKKSFGDEDADPFDIGSGHIVPKEALDPGLAYDAGSFDYLAFICGDNILQVSSGRPNSTECANLEANGLPTDGSNLNYPSIAVSNLLYTRTVSRTVTNVMPSAKTGKRSLRGAKSRMVEKAPMVYKTANNPKALTSTSKAGKSKSKKSNTLPGIKTKAPTSGRRGNESNTHISAKSDKGAKPPTSGKSRKGKKSTTSGKAGKGTKVKFEVSVDAPPGIYVAISPISFKLGWGATFTYMVTMTAKDDTEFNQWAFGSLTWSYKNKYSVYSPIAVKPIGLDFPNEIIGMGTEGSLVFNIGFGYSGAYSPGTHGLAKEMKTKGYVEDDPTNSYVFFPRGPGIARFPFSFSPNTAWGRFSLFDEFTDGEHDLDLYVWKCSRGCSIVGESWSLTSSESVDVPYPSPDDLYIVDVHGFDTNGSGANFELFSWSFGLDDNRNNMEVLAPVLATGGVYEPLTVSWTSLDKDSKYLGAVSHTGQDGQLMGLTLIDISTKPKDYHSAQYAAKRSTAGAGFSSGRAVMKSMGVHEHGMVGVAE